MAETGDVTSLTINIELREQGGSILLPIDKSMCAYLGITREEILSKKKILILKYDIGKFGKFLGIGVKTQIEEVLV